jgi:hypothetical protein
MELGPTYAARTELVAAPSPHRRSQPGQNLPRRLPADTGALGTGLQSTTVVSLSVDLEASAQRDAPPSDGSLIVACGRQQQGAGPPHVRIYRWYQPGKLVNPQEIL